MKPTKESLTRRLELAILFHDDKAVGRILSEKGVKLTDEELVRLFRLRSAEIWREIA